MTDVSASTATCPGLSSVVLGTWPLANMRPPLVTTREALRTMHAAFDAGITALDTAYAYGRDGRSDLLIGRFLKSIGRDRMFIIGKVGQRWIGDGRRVADGRPETLRADAEAHLCRVGCERFDLLLLHQPDPAVPLEQSAGAMRRLRDRGLARQVGICNATAAQVSAFAAAAPCAAVQLPLNMAQQRGSRDVRRWCAQRGVAVLVYWVLMKGLLAGRIRASHRFAPGDPRPEYPIFRGDERRRTDRLNERLAALAKRHGVTAAQIAVRWALEQEGVTAALVGARAAEQVRETAAAAHLRLPPEAWREIEDAVRQRGECSGA